MINKSSKHIKHFSIQFSKILIVFFVLSILAIPFAKADNIDGQQDQEYTIKLYDQKYLPQLFAVGSSVRHRFSQVTALNFVNIFSFSSKYTLSQLQSFLIGEYNYLEIDRDLQTQGVLVNDPGFTSDSQNIDKQWGLAKAGFDIAWEKTIGTSANLIGVVDTGIDETHQDLKSINFVTGFNFLTNQTITPGTNSDDNGHGTLVAGVLGATPNNSTGIVGTNWQVSIMPLKALSADGKGDADAVAEAIVWATDHGVQFLNLSVGGIGFGHDTALSNAISYAFNHNVAIVAAAGNDTAATGGNVDQNPVFPICDDNNFNMVIGVTATDQNDIKPEFANYGRNCIDVTAPGKRILSTINYDPLTKKSAPNSYAYASGTSLGVPFVVGQAALIKALYPSATNIQIRDRIISTADPIDSNNLSQCGGSSCRGFLGAGRINVPKSLATAIAQNFNEGDLVKAADTGAVYEILGGQKRLVSPFVLNQKFPNVYQKQVTSGQLAQQPEGSYITPNDGTLVKYDAQSTIYQISNGQKLPITAQVFRQRKFSFYNINTLSVPELDSWATGTFLPPIDGSLLKTLKNRTVYWVVGGVLHPINNGFYINRGLNLFPVLTVPDNDVASYAKGEAYIR
jgi:hypothetical protein